MKWNALKFGLVLAACLLSVGVYADDTTLTGEAVDVSCYLTGKSGEGHASCAKACVNSGKPIGFVVKDGDDEQMYLVLGGGGKAAKDLLADHMGKQITVRGTVVEKDGMRVITVASVE